MPGETRDRLADVPVIENHLGEREPALEQLGPMARRSPADHVR